MTPYSAESRPEEVGILCSGLLLDSNGGGVGSCKWDNSGLANSGVGNTTRDAYFATLYQHYAVTGSIAPHQPGAMPAP